VAVTSNQSKAQYLKALGANEVVISEDGKFKSSGADLSFEAVGAPTFESSFRALKPGKRDIVLYLQLSQEED
jgi:NADPH:quinone reductase-like Zn-dependent oxidoreductase